MKYTQKSFQVPASGKREECKDGCKWIDSRGNCVLCGKPEQETSGEQNPN